MRRDPYRVLGVPPTASAEELHDAYRTLIKLHHPDRNGGSAESTARFQEIQAAYEAVRDRPRAASTSSESVEERMAKLEGEVRAAQAEREKARAAARQALRDLEPDEPAPAPVAEEEDSISAILFDIVDEIGERLTGPRRDPAVRRVSDLIDGLDDLSSRLDRKP